MQTWTSDAYVHINFVPQHIEAERGTIPASLTRPRAEFSELCILSQLPAMRKTAQAHWPRCTFRSEIVHRAPDSDL